MFLPAETWVVYVKKLQAELKTEFGPFLRDELKRLLEMIVEFTPPATGDQGRKRVERDIGKLVRPLMADTFRSPSVQHLIERRDVAAFEKFAQNVPTMRGHKIIRAEDVPELHRQNRDARGRVLKKQFMGNWVWGGDQIKTLRDYIAHKKDNVGIAIAGWLPALRFLGGNVNKPVTILDQPEHGRYVDNLNSDKPHVQAINSTPWAARKDEGARIIRNAQEARTQIMMRRLVHILEGAAARSAKRRSQSSRMAS